MFKIWSRYTIHYERGMENKLTLATNESSTKKNETKKLRTDSRSFNLSLTFVTFTKEPNAQSPPFIIRDKVSCPRVLDDVVPRSGSGRDPMRCHAYHNVGIVDITTGTCHDTSRITSSITQIFHDVR